MAVRNGLTLTTVATAALLLSGTGVAAGSSVGDGPHEGGDRGDVRHHGADYRLRASGQFTAGGDGSAVTYDRRLVPQGAGIEVTQRADGTGMSVAVQVRGVAPDHTFGVHVHTGSCTADPDAAGPHYQNVPDPEQPSVDPAYANPRNEVWLDFTSGSEGTVGSTARHSWQFRPGEARSVVLHERATSRKPGEAGMAGDRVACFTVPFMGVETPSDGA